MEQLKQDMVVIPLDIISWCGFFGILSRSLFEQETDQILSFPNGRWGPSDSPAFSGHTSTALQWGSASSLPLPAVQALQTWAAPTSRKDIADLFISYLNADIDSLPWSDEPSSAETALIKDELIKLNQKGYWTLASQPAVNGEKSSHEVLGWGPKGGYVFQKAFVEMFVPAADFAALKAKLQQLPEVSFMAQSAANEFVKSSDAETMQTDAVTWGVFSGKEIVSPTIVEEDSFRSWAAEAWHIWAEWSSIFGAEKKASREFLKHMGEDGWLVNVIWHDYVDMSKGEREGLWETLLKG